VGKTDGPIAVVVCDAGPLIHLDELGSLALLADFPRIIVPETVWQEVEKHRPGALSHRSLALERLPVPASNDPAIESVAKLFSLHRGEKEALLAMRKFACDLLLTDDAAARLAAKVLGMRAHGTLAVLIRSIRRGQRNKEEVLSILRSIPQQTSLFIKRSLLEEAIQQVEKEI
jgi:predicted nucleic acid-binding protein